MGVRRGYKLCSTLLEVAYPLVKHLGIHFNASLAAVPCELANPLAVKSVVVVQE